MSVKFCETVGHGGEGDDLNTILRFLLEETSRNERKFTHIKCTKGSDSRLSKTNDATIADVGCEVRCVQTCVSLRLCQLD